MEKTYRDTCPVCNKDTTYKYNEDGKAVKCETCGSFITPCDWCMSESEDVINCVRCPFISKIASK